MPFARLSAKLQRADSITPLQLRELHLLDDLEPHSAALNMAIDEVLLGSVSVPTLRVYRWSNPALSFGYFGRFVDAVQQAGERELVRRWTGGGIVLHGSDVTYSFLLPETHIAATYPSRAVYSYVHRAIGRALPADVQVELAATNAPRTSEACFANPVIADVLVAGRKIAGAAQRRTRAGLLHQGSVQYAHLPRAFITDFAAAVCPAFTLINPCVSPRAGDLAAQKYGSVDWLRRH